MCWRGEAAWLAAGCWARSRGWCWPRPRFWSWRWSRTDGWSGAGCDRPPGRAMASARSSPGRRPAVVRFAVDWPRIERSPGRPARHELHAAQRNTRTIAWARPGPCAAPAARVRRRRRAQLAEFDSELPRAGDPERLERVRGRPIAVRDARRWNGRCRVTGLNQPSDQRLGARSANEPTAVREASSCRRRRARLKTPRRVSRVKDAGPKRPHATKAARAR